MANIQTGIQETGIKPPLELPRRAANEVHLVIESPEALLKLCQWAKEHHYYLCTMVATDERLLEDHAFKLYYVLSDPKDKLIILEHPLNHLRNLTQYSSLKGIFAGVGPLEEEMYDLLGLSPQDYSMDNKEGFILHKPYPFDLYPLKRTRSLTQLRQRLQKPPKSVLPPKPLPEGMVYLPVGPIHAGVIEAGQFRFYIAGEVVEDLEIRLGYKHKGIEKLFETKYNLETGWQLAERVSGDSSFAHSLAYCQAVEGLAGVKLPTPALYWRNFFLELERLYNHIADFAALTQDMAFDLVASQIFILRETMVQLNHQVASHRLLRGLNRPGGIMLSRFPDLNLVEQVINRVTDRFLQFGKLVLDTPTCRDRTLGIGILTAAQARDCGATGLVARASGLLEHDFRLRHPQNVFACQPDLLELLRGTVISEEKKSTPRQVAVRPGNLQGDIFARLALRIAEVETSAEIIRQLLAKLKTWGPTETLLEPLGERLKMIPNLEFGLGYVESWRGEIFYWVSKGSDNSIFRCKVRDPSTFNWPALRLAVIRNPATNNENLLADFPLINKSFNLSYSGYDL